MEFRISVPLVPPIGQCTSQPMKTEPLSLGSGDRDMGISPMMANPSHDEDTTRDQFESKLLGPIGTFSSVDHFPPNSAHEPTIKQLKQSSHRLLLSLATTFVLW